MKNIRSIIEKFQQIKSIIKSSTILILACIVFSSFSQSQSFDWAKRMGAIYSDGGSSIAVDASGSVFTTGWFEVGVDFDPNAGSHRLLSAGYEDIFIQKLDNRGNFLWAKTMGGSGDDFGQSITTDNWGNVYTSGYFSGWVDFDPDTSSSHLIGSNGSWGLNKVDAFVQKLDPSGNFLWAKAIGGSLGEAHGKATVVDDSGYVYTTGPFWNTASFGDTALTAVGTKDCFIQKLDSSGNLVWAKSIGGTGSVIVGNSIAVDDSGFVYITETFGIR